MFGATAKKSQVQKGRSVAAKVEHSGGVKTSCPVKLKTHFGCGVILLIPLAEIGSQFLGENIFEEGEGPYIEEHTLLHLITGSSENVHIKIIHA